MRQPHIVVIGSGVAGLSAAWLASRRARVTLVERDDRVGGHSNTVVVHDGTREIAVDTGFIVYNTACYPNLIALFDHLDVPTAPSSMSFAVSLDGGHYEYSGSGPGGLFAEPRNILSLDHWRMIGGILRFFREAAAAEASMADGRADVTAPALGAPSLGEWLAERRYSRSFIDRHIVPMAAAIWSTPNADVLSFPAAAFIRFFANHGLLQIANRPQWRTVAGGSREYVSRLLADTDIEVLTGCGARRVIRGEDRDDTTGEGGVEIMLSSGRRLRANHVVLATHADDALALLGDADELERRVLGSFRYARNTAVLHRDRRLMPRRRHVWSSWNVIGQGGRGGASAQTGVCVTYWMNRLQPLNSATDYFVTLNAAHDWAPRDVIARFEYEHPLFDGVAIEAQRTAWELQGRRRTWFAGSYFGYGFHEDGVEAGLAVAEQLTGTERPWQLPATTWKRVAVGPRPAPPSKRIVA